MAGRIRKWLAERLDLRAGRRMLDLGCGRAMPSLFLHREFGVQVWAADWWFRVDKNRQRIADAGAEEGVCPLHADARSLPFSAGFFDAIVCIDSYVHFATAIRGVPIQARHDRRRIRQWCGDRPM